MHWALLGLQQTGLPPGPVVPGMKMPVHCSPAAHVRTASCVVALLELTEPVEMPRLCCNTHCVAT